MLSVNSTLSINQKTFQPHSLADEFGMKNFAQHEIQIRIPLHFLLDFPLKIEGSLFYKKFFKCFPFHFFYSAISLNLKKCKLYFHFYNFGATINNV